MPIAHILFRAEYDTTGTQTGIAAILGNEPEQIPESLGVALMGRSTHEDQTTSRWLPLDELLYQGELPTGTISVRIIIRKMVTLIND